MCPAVILMLSEITEELGAEKVSAWPEPCRFGERKSNYQLAFLRAGKPNQCKGNSVTCYLEQESCFLLINQTKC